MKETVLVQVSTFQADVLPRWGNANREQQSRLRHTRLIWAGFLSNGGFRDSGLLKYIKAQSKTQFVARKVPVSKGLYELVAGVSCSLCCTKEILDRPLKRRPYGSVGVSVSEWKLWDNACEWVKSTFMEAGCGKSILGFCEPLDLVFLH